LSAWKSVDSRWNSPRSAMRGGNDAGLRVWVVIPGKASTHRCFFWIPASGLVEEPRTARKVATGLAPRRCGECDPAPLQVVGGRSQPRLRRGQDLPEHPVALTGNKASNCTFSTLPFAGMTLGPVGQSLVSKTLMKEGGIDFSALNHQAPRGLDLQSSIQLGYTQVLSFRRKLGSSQCVGFLFPASSCIGTRPTPIKHFATYGTISRAVGHPCTRASNQAKGK
jgi:hypothetical protein